MNMPAENMASQMPSENKLPVMQTLREAWEDVPGFKATIWVCILIVLAFSVLFHLLHAAMMHDMSLASILQIQKPAPKPTIPVSLLDIFYSFFNLLLSSGTIYVAIRHVAKLTARSNMMWHSFKGNIAWSLIITTLLLGLIIVGLVLLSLIPTFYLVGHYGQAGAPDSVKFYVSLVYVALAIIWAYIYVRLMLFMPIILDRELGPIDALKLSSHSTKGYFWRIVGVTFLTSLIVIVSMIPAGIGLIWTLPFAYCVNATIYKKLAGIQTVE